MQYTRTNYKPHHKKLQKCRILILQYITDLCTLTQTQTVMLSFLININYKLQVPVTETADIQVESN